MRLPTSRIAWLSVCAAALSAGPAFGQLYPAAGFYAVAERANNSYTIPPAYAAGYGAFYAAPFAPFFGTPAAFTYSPAYAFGGTNLATGLLAPPAALRRSYYALP